MSYRVEIILQQYSVRKPDKPVDSDLFSDQDVIAELDSALNKWVNSVPDHRKSFLA